MTVGWFMKALTQYADFSGRARRREFWWFVLIEWLVLVALLSFTAVTLAPAVDGTNVDADAIGLTGWVMVILTTFVAVALIVPYWAVTVRRLHDTGRSGWWSLFLLVLPIVVYILALFDSEAGPNMHGPDPKETERGA